MENSFWQVAVVTKISFFLSGLYVDGLHLLLSCVCELVLLQCSSCHVHLTCERSLDLRQTEIGIPVNIEVSSLKVRRLSWVKLSVVNIGWQGLRRGWEMRPCTTFPFKATLQDFFNPTCLSVHMHLDSFCSITSGTCFVIAIRKQNRDRIQESWLGLHLYDFQQVT